MIAGTLLALPPGFSIEKLGGLVWERKEYGLDLKSVIQFRDRIDSGKVKAQGATVIHQFVAMEPSLKEERSEYDVGEEAVVKTTWANIFIAVGEPAAKSSTTESDPFVVIDNAENRIFVRSVIEGGLGLTPGTVSNIAINTQKMSEDHPDQWVKGFSDRQGKVDRGTVYGDGVETDSIFGPELEKSRSESVGWTTNFFGPPTKVRVSPRGTVLVLAWPDSEMFLRFLLAEILPYAVPVL